MTSLGGQNLPREDFKICTKGANCLIIIVTKRKRHDEGLIEESHLLDIA
jgi:hypothetical protein